MADFLFTTIHAKGACCQCCREDERKTYMQPTVEVRWFYRGNIQTDVWHRFQSERPSQDKDKVERRGDLYLYLPDAENLGIKLRGIEESYKNDPDKLEIKRRQLEAGIITFTSGVTGRLEYWSKWGFKSEAATSELSTFLREKLSDSLAARYESWIKVDKERCLCKYKVTDERKVLAVSLDEWLDEGCNVELTALSVCDQRWWTLGLEAFGINEKSIEDNLKLSASHIFTEMDLDISLEEKNSYGYPKWLESGLKH
jgi:hypothetical protein